jgi:CheY-like chemotaxis protein
LSRSGSGHRFQRPRLRIIRVVGARWIRTEAPVASDTGGVLIVDDEEDVRHALRLLFEIEGFSVVGEAGDGIEALTLVLKRQPSCVLLDLQMPRLDGEQTATILRQIAPEVRIVAFSSFLRHKPDWADAFLNKECISDLPALVSDILRSQAASLS